MELMEAIDHRRSVRKYKDDAVEEDKRTLLDTFAKELSDEGDIDIKIVYDDPEGFASFLARYGSFKNVRNFIILSGNSEDPELGEKCGYFGEKLVLTAETLGLSTCWVGLTFNKAHMKKLIGEDKKVVCVVALGYGTEEEIASRKPHKSKPMEKVVVSKGTMPEWFGKGVEAALKAPSAMNQQKFRFGVKSGEPAAVTAKGPYTDVDLGIAKCHFEIATGRKVY